VLIDLKSALARQQHFTVRRAGTGLPDFRTLRGPGTGINWFGGELELWRICTHSKVAILLKLEQAAEQ